MNRLWKLPPALVAAALVTGCGGSVSTAEETKTLAPDLSNTAIGHGAGELNCRTFPFDNSGHADWRRDSYSFGPFGVSHNFAAGKRGPDGLFRSKTPMLVEGHRTVVVTVSATEQSRVAIETLKPDRPITTLTLEPCPDKRRTMWAAGFVLRDRRPFTLGVRIGERRGIVHVGSPESR